MLKILGLVLAAGLLFITSCGGDQSQNQNKGLNNNQTQRESGNAALTNANATPAPSPAQTAPMTATVKNAGLKMER